LLTCIYSIVAASLSSDEDDLDTSSDYLESLQDKLANNKELQALNVTATLQDEDSDDDDFLLDNEETALEAYTTPLDEDDCGIDEYVVFKQVMQGRPSWHYFGAHKAYSLRLSRVCPQCYFSCTSQLCELGSDGK